MFWRKYCMSELITENLFTNQSNLDSTNIQPPTHQKRKRYLFLFIIIFILSLIGFVFFIVIPFVSEDVFNKPKDVKNTDANIITKTAPVTPRREKFYDPINPRLNAMQFESMENSGCFLTFEEAADFSETKEVIDSDAFTSKVKFIKYNLPKTWCGDSYNSKDAHLNISFSLDEYASPYKNTEVIDEMETKIVDQDVKVTFIKQNQRADSEATTATYYALGSVEIRDANDKAYTVWFRLDMPDTDKSKALEIISKIIPSMYLIEESEVYKLIENPKSKATCIEIPEVKGYQYCETGVMGEAYITGPSNLLVLRVDDYIVSPSKRRIFVDQYSLRYLLNAGAPSESALSMIDINSNKAYELAEVIWFPSYLDVESWDKEGLGIAITATTPNIPAVIRKPDTDAVLYCKTSCKFIADGVMRDGIMPEPAYFENGKLCYLKQPPKKSADDFRYGVDSPEGEKKCVRP